MSHAKSCDLVTSLAGLKAPPPMSSVPWDEKDYFQVTDELAKENSHFTLSEALLAIIEQVSNDSDSSHAVDGGYRNNGQTNSPSYFLPTLPPPSQYKANRVEQRQEQISTNSATPVDISDGPRPPSSPSHSLASYRGHHGSPYSLMYGDNISPGDGV